MHASSFQRHASILGLILGALATISPAMAAASFPQPGATPENVKPDAGDFPYMPPMPGSVLIGGVAPLDFRLLLSDIKEEDFVANNAIWKTYTPPPDATRDSLHNFYLAALTQARWNIVLDKPGGNGASAVIYAHYGLNGRNIWAYLLIGKTDYDLLVADATVIEAKLVVDLAAHCHLALMGVLFDFGTSKLRPESDPVLAQVAAMMTNEPKLKLDVQDYTDGLGSQESNLSLSKARADAVAAWLTDHGVTAGQLDAQGFGAQRPVASNDTAQGRARNRRVEIANPGCKAADQ